MWCEFFRTVHMLLLNVLSSSTVVFYSRARPLLPKLANSRLPFFLLVHKWKPSRSLNQRNLLHRNIRHIITPLHVCQRQIPSRISMQRYVLFWGLNSNLKYTSISDDGRFGNAVDGEYAWGIAWWGVWRDCWTDICWSKECGLSSIALSFVVLFQPFFCQDFLDCYGYKEVITREDSFEIVWFDRDSYKTLRIASDSFFRIVQHGPAWFIFLRILEYLIHLRPPVNSFEYRVSSSLSKRDPERRLVTIRWEIRRRQPVLRL